MKPSTRSVVTVLAAFVVIAATPSPSSSQAVRSGVIGHVTDEDGAAVFGVDVILEGSGGPRERVSSDRQGFYRFENVPPGRWTLRGQRIGYAEANGEVVVVPDSVAELDLVLLRAAVDLPGLSVEAVRSRERERFEETAGPTVREMDVEEIKRVPGLAEADPVRAVEVLPGVVSTSDLSSAFHVRGGSADQNLILLDGVPIYSPFHLGGFFSVFNADMLERAELASGGFSARHGGRVSSVLTIESDAGEGDFGVDAGISVLASRLALGDRLGDGTAEALGLSRGRWRVSARRSYFDVLLAPVLDFPYHLTDMQGVFEGWTRGGDRITITAYHGSDVVDFTRVDPEDFPLRIDWSWGNDLIGARWVRPRRRGGFVALSGGYTRYGTGLSFPDFDDTEFRSRISTAFAEGEFDMVPAGRWRVRGGARAERTAYDNLAASGGTEFGRGNDAGWLLGAFTQAEWRRPGAWLVEAGFRMDGWTPGDGDATWVPSPRVAVKRFFAGSHWAVKAAAGRYTQFLHSLRDEELPIGLDVWVLAGARAPHVVSDQVQAGVEGFLGEDRDWNVALEAYYRSFDGVVTFNPADDPNDRLDDILAGEGTSYGADLLVRRSRGAVNGWLALSWLRAERTFPDMLSPLQPPPEVSYPPIFDRRVDADLVLRFPLPKGVEGGLRWNLGTGIPYTRALGSYRFWQPDFVRGDGTLVWSGADEEDDPRGGYAVLLGARNGTRYPVYHRLDVGFRKTFTKSWGTLVPYLDIVNVYNQRNVLFYFYEYDRTPPTRSGVSMFPFLPSIGLEVHF